MSPTLVAEARRDFSPAPASLRAVRAFVGEVLAASPHVDPHTVCLIADELAANAVEHAQTPFSVTIRVYDTEEPAVVRVEVADHSPDAPRRLRPTARMSHGWGLNLVDRAATRWGWEAQPLGKLVWFEVEGSVPG